MGTEGMAGLPSKACCCKLLNFFLVLAWVLSSSFQPLKTRGRGATTVPFQPEGGEIAVEVMVVVWW
jgi:hypothetical protein